MRYASLDEAARPPRPPACRNGAAIDASPRAPADATGRAPLRPTPPGAEAPPSTSEARFRAVWEASADALALSDSTGVVLDVNPAYCRLYGLAPEQVLGWSFAVIFPEAARPGAEAEYRAAFAGPATAPLVTTSVRGGDGAHHQVEVSYTFLVDAAGRRTAMLSVIRDVTARDALLDRERAALAEAERLRQAFLSSASHDLKTPLTAVQGFVQLAHRRLTRTPNPATAVGEVAALLDQADAAAGQLARQLEDLGDVLAGSAGKALHLERQPVDMVALARRAVAQAAALAPQPISLEGDTSHAFVFGDPLHLGRVLDNLLANAVKYSPDGGAIVVRVDTEHGPTGRQATVTVRDQGMGIPAADVPHVFERFQRGGNVVGRIWGSGVGLASVQQIVAAHDGAVSVASVEGAGSTFTVSLPLTPEQRPATPSEAAPAADG